ncbi:MAG: hypothetical protein HN929_07150 [Chloroflexi bacterium]|jgi:uncharacterized membrane protein YfcA|nr:hypothetical protein [Chloroflexota bacterium]MBT7081224.1 hypothetical protein [Chloroflexota bacterium]MBT7290113.1 hypothetical protein [Chloroflexota bacterium]
MIALLVGVPIGVVIVLTTDNSTLSIIGVVVGVVVGQMVTRRYTSKHDDS